MVALSGSRSGLTRGSGGQTHRAERRSELTRGSGGQTHGDDNLTRGSGGQTN